MPSWFTRLTIFAAAGMFACLNPAFVSNSIMVTGGLMIPVWTLAVNLWWLALVAAPFAWYAYRSQPIRGLLTSAVLLAALVAIPTLYIAQHRASVVPAPINSADLIPLPGPARSLEILFTDDRDFLHDCDPLCQQLLQGGDLDWLRMASSPDSRLPQRTIVYYRANAAECAAIDPGFPAQATCLLARPDDAAKADLQLHLTELGDFTTPMDQNHGLVALTGVQKLTLTDTRNNRTLITQSRYGWSEPMVGFLEPDYDITLTIQAHGGFRLHQKRLYSGTIDLRAAYAQVGLRMALPRQIQPIDSPAGLTTSHGAYLQILPYDGPLQASMFDVAQGKPTPTGSATEMFLRNLPGLVAKRPSDPVKGKQFQPNAKQGLPVKPRPADDDLGGWLAQITTRQGLDALQALNIVGDMVSGAPPGTYDADSDAFLAALDYAPGLTPLLGNFAFDPVPHLRDLWTAGVDEQTDALVLQAACHADARWSESLAPFVYEAGQSLIPRYHDPKFFGAALDQTILILLHLNHADLAQSLIDQIDWAIIDGLSPMAKFGTFPPITATLLQSHIAKPTPCRD